MQVVLVKSEGFGVVAGGSQQSSYAEQVLSFLAALDESAHPGGSQAENIEAKIEASLPPLTDLQNSTGATSLPLIAACQRAAFIAQNGNAFGQGEVAAPFAKKIEILPRVVAA